MLKVTSVNNDHAFPKTPIKMKYEENENRNSIKIHSTVIYLTHTHDYIVVYLSGR